MIFSLTNTLKGITVTKGGVNMDENKLIDAIYELDHRIIELESDVYDMRRDNDELRRRVSDLESKKKMPRF